MKRIREQEARKESEMKEDEKDTTPPKKKNTEQDAEKMLNSLFSPDKTDSTNSSPMQTPQKPRPKTETDSKGKGNVGGTKAPSPAYKVPSPIHVGQRKVTPLQPMQHETAKLKDPLSMFDNSSSSDEEQLAPAHNNSLKINPDDDDPPGFSASDPESEPPGITDSSDSEDIKQPVKPAEPVPAIPTLPKPTSPKPVEAQTNPFDSEDERNVKKAKKEAKK